MCRPTILIAEIFPDKYTKHNNNNTTINIIHHIVIISNDIVFLPGRRLADCHRSAGNFFLLQRVSRIPSTMSLFSLG